MAMTLEQFTERFNGLSTCEKVSIYNNYQSEHGDPDDMLNSFDEDFFNMCFERKPMEAVRAAYFGKIHWDDEYIRFDTYGNLESFSEFEAKTMIEDEIEDIFSNPDIWEDYIEDKEEEEDEEE